MLRDTSDLPFEVERQWYFDWAISHSEIEFDRRCNECLKRIGLVNGLKVTCMAVFIDFTYNLKKPGVRLSSNPGIAISFSDLFIKALLRDFDNYGTVLPVSA